MKKLAFVFGLVALMSNIAFAQDGSEKETTKEVKLVKCETINRDDIVGEDYRNYLHARIKAAQQISCFDQNSKMRIAVLKYKVDFGYNGTRGASEVSYLNSRGVIVFTKFYENSNNQFVSALLSSTHECPTVIFLKKSFDRIYKEAIYDFTYDPTCDILD